MKSVADSSFQKALLLMDDNDVSEQPQLQKEIKVVEIEQVEKVAKEIEELKAEEERIDRLIDELKNSRVEDEERYASYAYLTRDDISKVDPCNILVAVHPPKGSHIQIYSPEEIQRIYKQMGVKESLQRKY